MFIYILNLLNDGLKKKKNSCERLACEIINDSMYISQLSNINKNFSFEKISGEIVKVFEVLNKYSLAAKDSVEVLQKLIRNDNNLSAVEEIYNHYCNSRTNEFKLGLEFIIKDILKNSNKERNEIKVANYFASFQPVKKLEIIKKKDINARLHKKFAIGHCNIEISVENKEKVGLIAEGITYAGYEIAHETRKVELSAINAAL